MMAHVRRFVALAVGFALGAAVSLWQYFQAQAAVKVRPKLQEVGLIDAFLTGHGADWLFYHYPIPAGIVTTVFATGIVYAAIRWSKL